jgi:hypothetical protein
VSSNLQELDYSECLYIIGKVVLNSTKLKKGGKIERQEDKKKD